MQPTEVEKRAANLTDALLRTHTIDNLETLVAVGALYILAQRAVGSERSEREHLAVVRAAYARYRAANPDVYIPATLEEYVMMANGMALVPASQRYN